MQVNKTNNSCMGLRSSLVKDGAEADHYVNFIHLCSKHQPERGGYYLFSQMQDPAKTAD